MGDSLISTSFTPKAIEDVGPRKRRRIVGYTGVWRTTGRSSTTVSVCRNPEYRRLLSCIPVLLPAEERAANFSSSPQLILEYVQQHVKAVFDEKQHIVSEYQRNRKLALLFDALGRYFNYELEMANNLLCGQFSREARKTSETAVIENEDWWCGRGWVSPEVFEFNCSAGRKVENGDDLPVENDDERPVEVDPGRSGPPLERKALRSKVTVEASAQKKRKSIKPATSVVQDVERKSLRIPLSNGGMVCAEQTSTSTDTSSERSGGEPHGVNYLMDNVKRSSGWHPYVWYLMCRRPELETCGVKAKDVARIAGKEWEDLQRCVTRLSSFLMATIRFLGKYPVPLKDNKPDIRQYRYFLAHELPTPNLGVITQALKEVAAQQASE